jgi:16S rRNA (guanine527-N7)-methyltransferase
VFADELSKLNIRLTPEQSAKFDRYLQLLQEWSKRMNLVGNARSDVVRSRHFAESIALGAALREREVLRPDAYVIDIGTGGGFPGVPIKLVWPQIKLTLLEATAKKSAFLAALVDALTLDDVEIITARAEDAAHEASLRGKFDIVLARAVAPLPTLAELTLPFARIRGKVIALKGAGAHDEVIAAAKALQALGATARIVAFEGPVGREQFVAIVKERDTPQQYPRRPGMPAKRPL